MKTKKEMYANLRTTLLSTQKNHINCWINQIIKKFPNHFEKVSKEIGSCSFGCMGTI